MPKYAMHSDPKIRKAKYDAEKISGARHHAGRMEAERERERETLTRSAINGGGNDAKYRGKYEYDMQPVKTETGEAGISIFDPVLCEIAYRWFSAKNSDVLDPFAGGSVRGIVAAELGRNYLGIDLRPEQIAANEKQASVICGERKPRYMCGNSKNVAVLAAHNPFDFIFSCPPYFDLEVYSDNPDDLSTMDPKDFATEYKAIIKNCCDLLRNDRFACFVVGDVRDKKGNYLNFISLTIEAFLSAGLSLYNEAILLTAIGSLPIRAGRTFSATRKLGKTHQNVLVFLKGDARKATEFCGPVDVAMENADVDFPISDL